MTRRLPGAAVALLLAGSACTGCASDVPGEARAAPASPAPDLPGTAAGLEDLLVPEVPSGLPRVPDLDLDPPAGEKTIDDVAGYADDAAEQRRVLETYGYQHGWERFWRSGDALTTVFVDQFGASTGAAAYAADLVRNDAEYYGGVPEADPPGLPADCAAMAVDEPADHLGLTGPTAFSWCPHGVFSVAVAATAGTPEAARAEVEAVTRAQLERLPR